MLLQSRKRQDGLKERGKETCPRHRERPKRPRCQFYVRFGKAAISDKVEGSRPGLTTYLLGLIRLGRQNHGNEKWGNLQRLADNEPRPRTHGFEHSTTR